MQRTSPVLVTVSYGAGMPDAEGLPTVSAVATNKKGSTTLTNFDLVNTGHSPSLKMFERVDPIGHLNSSPRRLRKN